MGWGEWNEPGQTQIIDKILNSLTDSSSQNPLYETRRTKLVQKVPNVDMSSGPGDILPTKLDSSDLDGSLTWLSI